MWRRGAAPRIRRMDSSVTARRVLARAAVLVGGVGFLAERLELTQRQLADHLTGAAPIPDEVFLAAIDVVLQELPDSRGAAHAGKPAIRPASEN